RRAQAAKDRDAVHLRQHSVNQSKIERLGRREMQRIDAAGHADDIMAEFVEATRDELGHFNVILGEEDSHWVAMTGSIVTSLRIRSGQPCRSYHQWRLPERGLFAGCRTNNARRPLHM